MNGARQPSPLEQVLSKLGPLFTQLGPFRFGLQEPVYDLVWRGLVRMGQAIVVTAPDGAHAGWKTDEPPLIARPPNFLLLGTIVYSLDFPINLPRI